MNRWYTARFLMLRHIITRRYNAYSALGLRSRQWKRRPIRAGVLALFFLTLCSSCTSTWPDNDSRAQILDLKITAAPIAWVDDHTLLLRFSDGEKVQRKDGGTSIVFRLITLNYRTGERRVYGRADSGICYADGYISYIYEDEITGEIVGLHGELGKEQVLKAEPGKLLFDRGPMGSCRPLRERPALPDWAREKTATMHLWPRLGLIACNVRSYSFNNRTVAASFHKAGDVNGIPLPFSCFDVRTGFKYYEFKQAYFTAEQDLVTPWPVGKDRKAFWLFADGSVETVTLPYSTAIRQDMLPTVAGIVAFSRPVSRNENYGVYLVTPGRTHRILDGHGSGVTSPDGCKVALLHDEEYDNRIQGRRVSVPVTLKILDFCTRK